MTSLLPPSRVLTGAGFALLIAVAGEIDTSAIARLTRAAPAAPPVGATQMLAHSDNAGCKMEASRTAAPAGNARRGTAASSDAGLDCATALLH